MFETLVNGELVDFANFGTRTELPNYGGANEHWLAYSCTLLAQERRRNPTADVYGHIVQEWSDGTRTEWDRYGDVFPINAEQQQS